jgi:subtilisin-like proprotein convertase family protein
MHLSKRIRLSIFTMAVVIIAGGAVWKTDKGKEAEKPRERTEEGSPLRGSVGVTERSVTAASVITDLLVPGKGHGQPWLDVPEWKGLSEKEQIARLIAEPFALKEGAEVNVLEVAHDELHVKGAVTAEALYQRFPRVGSGLGLLEKAEALQRRLGKEVMLVVYPAGAERTQKNRRVLTPYVSIQCDPALAEGVVQAALAAGAASAEVFEGAAGYVVAMGGKQVGAGLTTLARLAARPELAGKVAPLIAFELHAAAAPTDPYYSAQWYLKNGGSLPLSTAGVDVNAENVWSTRKGAGVMVAIVDDGIELDHPDLAPGYVAAHSRDYVGGDFDPSPFDYDPFLGDQNDNHGTSVAGLVIARENNAFGITGVSPRASWTGIRLNGTAQPDNFVASAMAWKNDVVDIKVCSWGPPDDLPNALAPMGPFTRDAIISGTNTGRAGKGVLYVFAAGNGRANGMQGNKNGYANNMYVNAVSAVNAAGELAHYSVFGAHIVATAPSSGTEASPKILTTDRAGVPGYNAGGSPGDVANAEFTNRAFAGTSAAAPLVSGVIALMLEANPNLSWRDVKEILLRTGKRLNPADAGWVTRSGGRGSVSMIKHHHQYGGGLVDAEAAVALASAWVPLGAMVTRSKALSPAVAIPDANATGVTAAASFATDPLMRVEHVEVLVRISHPNRGDLDIQLVSPAGVVSQLATPQVEDNGALSWPSGATISPASRGYMNWTFSSLRHWGESSVGVWNVIVRDTVTGNVGQVEEVTVRLHGMEPAAVFAATPPQNLIVLEGQPFSFSVVAGGTPDYTYQWMKDGEPIPGATQASYSDPSAVLAEAGTYSVEISNGYSSATVSAKLGVIQPAPPVVSGNLGGPVSLPVVTAGPDLQYVWKRGGVPLTNGDGISGATTPTLTLANLGLGDDSATAGEYELCVLFEGQPPVSAGPMQLTVLTMPSVTTPPVDRVVFVGASPSFTVEVAGPGPIGLQWARNGSVISGATAATYVRPNVVIADAGTFRVTATNSAGSAFAEALLGVIQPLPPTAVVNLGGTLSLPVVAAGTGLTYQWLRNGVPLVNDGRIGGVNTSTLTVANAALTDDSDLAGLYECVVTIGNSAPLSAGLVDVTVRPPPVIQSAPQSLVRYVGESIGFTVVATSDVPISYQWQRNGVNVGGATAASYTKSAAALTDGGAWTVNLTNVAGSSSATAGLAVIEPAPPTRSVVLGQTFVQSVNVVAPVGTTYRWLLNGVPLVNGGRISGVTTTQLTITGMTQADDSATAGNYELMVTVPGAAERGARATAVTVITAPELVNPLRSQVVLEGSPFTFTPEVTGSLPMTHGWRRGATTIAGATAASYGKPSAALTDAAEYSVTLTNAAGSATGTATLGVVQPLPPTATAIVGGVFALKVNAAGPGLVYQWLLNGVPLLEGGRFSGTSSDTLRITNVALTDDSGMAGAYECVVTVGDSEPLSARTTLLSVRNAPAIEFVGGPIGPLVVSGPAEIEIDPGNGATGYVITGLPSGLTYDRVTGRIHGTPNVAVTDRPITITARTPTGNVVRTITLTVLPIHPDLIGPYYGLVGRNAHFQANRNIGGEVKNFVLTKTGHYTGRICLLNKSYPIRGRIVNSAVVDPVGTTVMLRPGLPRVVFDFTLNVARTSLSGHLTQGEVWQTDALAYRNAYSNSQPALTVMGIHNFWMEKPQVKPAGKVPEGSFNGGMRINRAGGVTIGVNTALTAEVLLRLNHVTGFRMARMSVVTKSEGRLLIPYHLPLYQLNGSCQGWFEIEDRPPTEDNLVFGTMTWNKLGPISSLDRFYREGFDFGVTNEAVLTVAGSEYRWVPRERIMGDRFLPVPAEFTFDFQGDMVDDPLMRARLATVFSISPAVSKIVRTPLHLDFIYQVQGGTNPSFEGWCCDHGGTFRGSTVITHNGLRREVHFHARYAPGLRRGGGYFMMVEVPTPPFTASNAPVGMGYMSVLPSR